MAWFGEMRGYGKDWMLWNQNIGQLTQLGFKVETFDNDSGLYRYLPAEEAKAAYLDRMAWLAQNNYLHGLYFMGHGSSGAPWSVGSADPNVFTWGPIWSVEYAEIDALIDYKLGALIIHACYGNNSDARSRLLSTHGIYWGVHGIYTPFLVDPIAKLWGEEKKNGEDYWGGDQKTNPFEIQ